MFLLSKTTSMKKLYPLFLLLLIPFLSGCEVIGDIFKAGFWVGIVTVILVVGLIMYLVGKMRK